MMRANRTYPDEPSGPFPDPPERLRDREGRDVEVRAADAADLDAIVRMYVAFDPADRAQGIPPTGEERVREWVGGILEEGLNVAAWHDAEERVAGHATLVPDGTGEAWELAIFVLQSYQRAGIGRVLLETLLGYGEREGVEFVWLTVERWNHAAIGLYEDVGFETSGAESFDLEMSIRLDPARKRG